MLSISSVQSLTSVWLFATPWTAACQASLSITSSWSLPKSMSIELVMLSNQSFLTWGSFQMGQLFASGGQSIGVSASASHLPMNIQDWFPLGWTGWISLQSKGLSRVFSSTTVQKHKLSVLSFLYTQTQLFFGTLHSNGYIFSFLFCFSLLFSSQLSVRPPQAAILLFFFHFFFLGIVLIPVSSAMSQTSVHSLSGTLSIRSNPLNIFLTSTV